MVLDSITTEKSYDGVATSLDSLLSLNKHIEHYLIACKVEGKSARTIEVYSTVLQRFLKFNPPGLTTNDIRLFLLDLQQTLNPFSVHIYYRSLKTFCNWLVAEEYLRKSPMAPIKPPKLPRLVIEPLTRQDISNLMLVTSGNKFLALRNRAILLVFLDTGIRLNELAGIQLPDVDLNRETIKVYGKGGKERYVRIGRTTQKAVLKYAMARNSGLPALWLTEEKRPLSRDGVQILINRLCAQAEVSGGKHGPHRLRHTAAIFCLRNHMSEFVLQQMLGHTTLEMTRRYVSSLGSDDVIRQHKLASPVDNL